MTDAKIAIIGSGIVGVSVAHHLTENGHAVDMFEKGDDYPYPHNPQWEDIYLRRREAVHVMADFRLPDDLKRHTHSGLQTDLEETRHMWTGGSATHWEAITPRMIEADFRAGTTYGIGDDWPLSYDDLEPYYGMAERLIGVAGTDDDNPTAPPRSTPYPLPPFELADDDNLLAERLADAGIILHTTPQARTRQAYDGRQACVNFNTCAYCPIGARYSPGIHLSRAIGSGLCHLRTGVSVRRIVPDANGVGATVVYRENDGADDIEARYDVVVICAGAVETARLLLLSADERHPDGLGNSGGHVGRGLTFHHTWRGELVYDEDLFPGRTGVWTGQIMQFLAGNGRGEHGAVKVEFSSRMEQGAIGGLRWEHLRDSQTVVDQLTAFRRTRPLAMVTEVAPSAEKYVRLSEATDRFGDPFAHVHYEMDDFDAATYDFALSIFGRIRDATRATGGFLRPFEMWDTAAHHMGAARMSETAQDGVVNSFGQLHDAPPVFALGGSMFVGSGGAVNPTLTMIALALRSAEYIEAQLL